ncbi:SnoaL-like polyketide cyclase [compost metagenome]
MNTNSPFSRRTFTASAATLVAGAALSSAVSAAGKNASPSRSEALIRRLYDAVNKKDLGVIAGYGASFSEWLDVPFDYTTKGERAIIDPWKSWFDIFPDATCEVRSLTAMGNHVVAQGIGRGTHRGVFKSPAGVLQPSAKTMAVAFCDVYELRGDKILRADSYFDFYGLVNQLVAEPLRVE